MAAITIGADPEFAFTTKSGTLISPGSVIKSGTTNVQFGIDGAGRVAELRPSASDTPRGLVKNIRDVLQSGLTRWPNGANYSWKAGGVAEEEPMGGHIHFGHEMLRDRSIATRVCSALNRTLAPIALMCEDKEEAVLRRSLSSYGHLNGGDCWRDQPWGMEYRVLSSWLTSPDDALGILSLGYLVAKNFDNKAFIDECVDLPEVDPDFFSECNKRVLSFYLQDIAKVLKKAIGWKDLLNDMKPMFSLIINGKSFDTSRDMKESWGLTMPATVGAV